MVQVTVHSVVVVWKIVAHVTQPKICSAVVDRIEAPIMYSSGHSAWLRLPTCLAACPYLYHKLSSRHWDPHHSQHSRQQPPERPQLAALCLPVVLPAPGLCRSSVQPETLLATPPEPTASADKGYSLRCCV